MYAVSRISAAFEVQLPLDRLFLIKTVGELLDLIEKRARLVPVRSRDLI